MSEIRVMVVAQDSLSRAGLAAVLAGEPGCIVAGQAPGDANLAQLADVYRPDVILWDLGWQPGPALAQLSELSDALGPNHLPLAVLLADEAQAGEAWAAGARVLLPRDISGLRLAAALAGAVQGLAVIEPRLAASLIAARGEAPGLPPENLTPREIEVLRLLAEGLANKAIARRLSISEHTVKFHVNAILGKLGVESRTEAVVRATRLGLILL